MARATKASTTATSRPAAPTKKASVKSTAAKAPATKTGAKSTAKTTAKVPAKKATATKAVATRAGAKSTAKAPAKAVAKKAPAKAPAKTVAKAAAKKAPAARKPAKAASPFDAKFLEAQKALLLEERQRLVHDADALTAEANALAEGREPGDVQFDEESGEGDTLAVERERDLALSAQFRVQVEEIDRALEKFADGTYGICEVSGTPIPKERLKAIPWARERVEYKVGGFGRR